MSLPEVGASMVLENEAQFRKALNEVNQGLKVNQSQLRLVEEQSKNTEDAQKALQNKMDALSDTITTQKEKVAILEQALQKSAEKTGEGSKKTLEWQAKLNDAKTALAKMENTLSDYVRQQEETTKATKDLGDETEKTSKSLKEKIVDGAQKAKQGFDSIKTNCAATVAAVGSITTAMFQMTLQVGQSAESIKNDSQTMGMSMAEYQEWDYIFKSVGYSASEASGDFAALAEKAKDAAEGTGDGAEVFDALGISVTKAGGKLKSQNELFVETVSKLQKMKDETLRNAYASQLLGTTGEELIPILNLSANELEALRQKAYETGSVMSDEAVTGFSKMNQANREMQQRFEAAKIQLATAFLPVLTKILDVVNAIPTPVLAAGAVFVGLGQVLIPVISGIYAMAVANKILSASNTLVAGTSAAAGVGLQGMLLAVVAIAAVLAILVGAGVAISNQLNGVQKAAESAQTHVDYMKKNVPKYARGTKSAKSGIALVGEEGPELVELSGGERIHTARKTRQLLGGTYQDNRTFIFKVDDIATYQKIMQRMKNEQMGIRQGFVGV